MATNDMPMSESIQRIIEEEVDRKLEPLVRESISKEEDTRFRQLKLIVILISVVGLGTFGTLANYLIEKAVDARIERSTGNISQAIEFMKFYTSSLKLELVQSFSQEDVDVILNYLRKAKELKEIRHSKEFLAALFQVTKSFTSANQSAAIDEIFSTYEREILSAPSLVQPLLHHYGQEIVASEFAKDDHAGYIAFAKLERVASSSHVPELALAYRVLFTSRRPKGNDDGLVARLISQSTALEVADRVRFFEEILLRTKAVNWMHKVTPEGQVIETVARKFLLDHSASIATAYNLKSKELLKTAATEGLSKDDAELLAMALAKNVD